MESEKSKLGTLSRSSETITSHFDNLKFTYLPKEENKFSGALAKLVSMIAMPDDNHY